MSAKIATPDKNCLRCKGTGLMTIAQYGTIVSCRCIYEERTEKELEPLKCPKCGNDGSSHPIFYLEEVTASRRVLGVKDGVVHIDANFKTSDEGAQQRFECSGCPDEAGTGPFTWVVPDSTDIEWV